MPSDASACSTGQRLTAPAPRPPPELRTKWVDDAGDITRERAQRHQGDESPAARASTQTRGRVMTIARHVQRGYGEETRRAAQGGKEEEARDDRSKTRPRREQDGGLSDRDAICRWKVPGRGGGRGGFIQPAHRVLRLWIINVVHTDNRHAREQGGKTGDRKTMVAGVARAIGQAGPRRGRVRTTQARDTRRRPADRPITRVPESTARDAWGPSCPSPPLPSDRHTVPITGARRQSPHREPTTHQSPVVPGRLEG